MAEIFTLWVADQYAKGCPSNASGRKVGYGSTRKGAIAACSPWANQGPWFQDKARRVVIMDQSGPALVSEEVEHTATDALGWVDCHPASGQRGTPEWAIADALEAGRYATACRLARDAGYLG